MQKKEEFPQIIDRIIHHSQNKKAHDICILDIRELSSAADFFVICHGDSNVQVKAISDGIVRGLKEDGFRPWHREGIQHLHWVLLDFVDVVVHVFHKETRNYYQLERIWGDAKIEEIQDDYES